MAKEKLLINTRVNIAPGARTIHARTFGETSPGRQKSSMERAPQQEAYEMLAVMCSMVVERALQRRHSLPPYGLVTERTSPKPVQTLSHLGKLEEAMDATLGEAHDDLMDELARKVIRGDSDRLAQFYRRYTVVMEREATDVTSHIRIQLGLNTATTEIDNILTRILHAYPILHPSKTLTIDEFLSIARNSWPLIAQLASMHLQRFSISPTTDDFFTELRPAPQGGYRLQCSEQGADFVRDESMNRYTNRPAYGCPARVNFGDGSAIKKLWDWYLEIIQEMHRRNYPTKSALSLLRTD